MFKTFRKSWLWNRTNRPATILSLVIAMIMLSAAASQISLTSQVKGILPIANGGTNATSTLTGIVRGGSAYTAAELSGDATTSGSNAVTVAKVNGTTVTTNSAADQTIVSTASATASWASIPNCTGGALQYATSTHLFSCGTILTGTFADAETPTGTINGVNTTFTLAHTPTGSSLALFKNGQELIAGGADYTLATATITTSTAPATGDVLIAFYRF